MFLKMEWIQEYSCMEVVKYEHVWSCWQTLLPGSESCGYSSTFFNHPIWKNWCCKAMPVNIAALAYIFLCQYGCSAQRILQCPSILWAHLGPNNTVLEKCDFCFLDYIFESSYQRGPEYVQDTAILEHCPCCSSMLTAPSVLFLLKKQNLPLKIKESVPFSIKILWGRTFY